MSLSPAETVRTLLEHSPGEALCDSCLAFACSMSLIEMREITKALPVEYPSIQRGGTCASCRRTIATVRFVAPTPKCAHCSRPLNEGEAGVEIDGDRFHDACLRRLASDETIRISRALSRRTRDVIQRSRQRMREGHAWPNLDERSD